MLATLSLTYGINHEKYNAFPQLPQTTTALPQKHTQRKTSLLGYIYSRFSVILITLKEKTESYCRPNVELPRAYVRELRSADHQWPVFLFK